jgi:rhodanese-related sulfurtransferase
MTMTVLITRSDLEILVAAGSVVLIDALPPSYDDQLHLPSALNLVESDVDTEAPRLLPDKTAAIVTDCSNEACGNSQAVANRLARLGYTAVRKYREGIQDWVTAGNPTGSSTSTA